MKNFYEVTVTDIFDKLGVEVELIEHDNPKYFFTVNEFPVVQNATLSFHLLDRLCFKCKVENGAVEIKRISVNTKEIMPIYLHLADPQTSWITDHWALAIDQPFYPWYHQLTGQGWIA